MYEIRKGGGVIALTEKPNYIRKHPDGFYILCEEEDAQGVAYHGTPYLFADGAQVHEVDAGELTTETQSLLDVLLTGEG